MLMSIKEFIPGTVGSIFNVYIGHPFDTIKVRMQDINSLYKSPMDSLYNTIRSEGIKGFYIIIVCDNGIKFCRIWN